PRRPHPVRKVLAFPPAHLGGPPPARRHDRAGIRRVGARLLPADEHFVSPIDGGRLGVGRRAWGCLALPLRLGPAGRYAPRPTPHAPGRLQVLPHPLPPALAPEAGLSIAAEPARRVAHVRAVDPH